MNIPVSTTTSTGTAIVAAAAVLKPCAWGEERYRQGTRGGFRRRRRSDCLPGTWLVALGVTRENGDRLRFEGLPSGQGCL